MKLDEYLKQVQKQGQTVNPLFKFLEVAVESITAQEAVLRLVVKKEFIQGAGVLAGGLVATLLDEAMAHVAIVSIDPARSTATSDINVRYLKPVRAGETIRGRAWVLKAGRRVVSVEAEARNEKDELVAKASATFIVL